MIRPPAGAHGTDVDQVRIAANPYSGRQVGMQIVGEAVELHGNQAVRAGEGVVGEHGGNGDEQAGCGHDQRLANRAGHLVEYDLGGAGKPDQGVVDPPHGTEQADEWRCRADRGQKGQAALDARLGIDHVGTHGAGHEFTGIDPGTDSACGILLMSLRSMGAGQGQAGEYAEASSRRRASSASGSELALQNAASARSCEREARQAVINLVRMTDQEPTERSPRMRAVVWVMRSP
jgi:hypothetical protein